jgi:putative aldouronate transport system permease protein
MSQHRIRKGAGFIRRSASDWIVDLAIYAALAFLFVVTLYPFVNMIAYSLNDAADSLRGGIDLLPRKWTLYNYQRLFRDATIFNATVISVLRTVIGSLATTACCFTIAYTLSRKEFFLRAFVTRFFIFTMFFSSGLIPYYLLMKSLGLVGTFWVYVVPPLVSAWNILLIRSYITQNIPDSLVEAARIDGANEFITLLRVVLPLSLPVIAVIILFTGVGQWNSWFDVYIYNNTKKNLSTLQFELQKMLQKTMSTSQSAGMAESASHAASAGGVQSITPQAMRAAMTIVATLPILAAYPFLQRYFVSGLTLGGIKG